MVMKMSTSNDKPRVSGSTWHGNRGSHRWAPAPAADDGTGQLVPDLRLTARCGVRFQLEAERELAAARGEQYAQVIDIGPRWDIGAPIPHLISNGSQAFAVCLASQPDPHWDGTYVTVVSPAGTVRDFCDPPCRRLDKPHGTGLRPEPARPGAPIGSAQLLMSAWSPPHHASTLASSGATLGRAVCPHPGRPYVR
jgi:hypothetical protein